MPSNNNNNAKKLNLSNNKKVLQNQIVKLSNELEELQLEREESKKNVLHFMQEADSARQELKRIQELLDELTTQHHLASPPPEKSDSTSTKREGSNNKISILLSRLSLLDQDQINKLFDLLEQPSLPDQLTKAQQDLKKTKSEYAILEEELDQIKQEYQATRGALTIENERAEIIEKRWKESESSLEQAESTIQSLTCELNQFRQRQECNATAAVTTNSKDHCLTENELCQLKEKYTITVQQLNTLQSRLEEKQDSVKLWQERHDTLLKQCVSLVISFYSRRVELF